jgi:1,4-dihydroxy-2-naphthoate octaprenyltransferase
MTYSYVPGTCNLGKSEIRRRQIVALLGAIFTISSFVGLLAADASQSARFSLFLPLMVFSIGFVQSRKRFCLAYGLMGTFNLGKLGDISRVQSPEDRKADRKTAVVILLQSAALALVLTLLLVALPF